jgi:hypothetical protein
VRARGQGSIGTPFLLLALTVLLQEAGAGAVFLFAAALTVLLEEARAGAAPVPLPGCCSRKLAPGAAKAPGLDAAHPHGATQEGCCRRLS